MSDSEWGCEESSYGRGRGHFGDGGSTGGGGRGRGRGPTRDDSDDGWGERRDSENDRKGGFRSSDNNRGGFRGSDSHRGGFRGSDNNRGGFRGSDSNRGGFRGSDNRGGHRDDGDDGGFSNKREGTRDFDDFRGGNKFSNDRKRDNDDNGNDNPIGDDKPKERYIPPEPTDDENVIFGSSISSGINFDKYDNIKIKVTGDNPVAPIESFSRCSLREFVRNNIEKSGYQRPTPVQKHAIPIILEGRDLMACAQTGSGKTAAFLVPIINILLEKSSEFETTSGIQPLVVILSPTRELAIQIAEEARKFSHGSVLKVGIAYGGTVAMHQAQQLSRGCHILVATPGRLNDYVARGRISFASVKFFVLDEADRMLDMGFLPDVEKMLNHETMVPVGTRQTLMFSATFPDDIQRLAGKYLHNYLFLAVGIVGGACADVVQVVYQVAKFDKKDKLIEILTEYGNQLTLVFVEQKRTADFIAAYLCENNFPSTSIHGDRLQSQREQALGDFKTGRMPTLVATAVAARGLDIKNVAHVINYDMPSSIDEYVHRIGRTGRVGNRGRATSFYDPSADSQLAGALIRILQQTEQSVPQFLQGEMGGGDDRSYGANGHGGSSFGGSDFRRGGGRGGGGRKFGGNGDGFNDTQGYSGVPAAVEDEEDW